VILNFETPLSVVDLVLKATSAKKKILLPEACDMYRDLDNRPVEPRQPVKGILCYDADGKVSFCTDDDEMKIQSNLTVFMNGDIYYLRALFTEPGLNFFIAQASPWCPEYRRVIIFPIEKLLTHPCKN
jgi:hypothetical protein